MFLQWGRKSKSFRHDQIQASDHLHFADDRFSFLRSFFPILRPFCDQSGKIFFAPPKNSDPPPSSLVLCCPSPSLTKPLRGQAALSRHRAGTFSSNIYNYAFYLVFPCDQYGLSARPQRQISSATWRVFSSQPSNTGRRQRIFPAVFYRARYVCCWT